MEKYRYKIRKSFYDSFEIKVVEAESEEQAENEIREFCYNAGYVDFVKEEV